MRRSVCFAVLAIGCAAATVADSATTAIVNTTLIDGNGGPVERGTTVLIADGRIMLVGPAARVAVPRGAKVIDGSGRWVMPGLVNTNIAYLHSAYFGVASKAARDGASYPPVDVIPEMIRETATKALSNGVTTIMDSESFAKPVVQVRDAIARGEVLGARIVLRGHVIGWGPTLSATMGGPHHELPASSKPYVDWTIALEQQHLIFGMGDDLMSLPLDALRRRLDAYLDLGIDQIKYAGTSHSNFPPVMAMFTLEQQRAMIETANRRGITVSTHCSSVEAMRQCARAGVDVFVHANVVFEEIPDDVIQEVVRSGAYCSIQLGPSMNDRPRAVRTNAAKLIKAGCKITTQDEHLGDGSPIATLEELVDLGMTPLQVITAATRTGAMSANLLAATGTVERGKAADLILLSADPTVDIRSLRQIELVMRAGVIVPKIAQSAPSP